MSRKLCMVCQHPHPEKWCVTFELTPAEEAMLVKWGRQVPEEFVYCSRCWRIIKDPEVGPRLLRDTAERQMLKLGVSPARAQKIADRYYQQLVQRQRGQPNQNKVH